mgnify:CR=1 FL=1
MFERIPASFSLLLWAALWEIGGRLMGSDLVPPFSTVVLTAIELVQMRAFQAALLVTARAFFIGMALAVVVGIPVGVLMGKSRIAGRMLNIWVNIFISAPLTAVVPALMPLLGIGETTVIATVFLFAVWVIIIDTQEGVGNVNPTQVEMARTFGATPRQMFFRILLPAAMPEIITGLRLAVIRGIKGVIIGQIIIALVGFGELFEVYLQSFQMDRFWALVLIIFGLGFVLVELVGIVERRVAFYARAR